MQHLPAGGRYSKHLPSRLIARYQEARSDPDLLAMRDELALIDTRLSDVLERLNTGESPAAWGQISGLIAQLLDDVAAAEDGDDDALGRVRVSGESIQHLVATTLDQERAWKDARTLITERMALVESERRRMVDLKQMISAEQVLLLAGALVATVKQHVSDPRQLAAIAADIDRVLSRNDQVGVPAS